uniref:Uncharacterized protein n=1 Tax=Rangifer tarandus platyrhynchus TaxID=3082113 RepID=A0ACB0F4V8_RANTA|nr:unnamed protein product [Rangifer tarandus platyrhynchus]
MQRASGNTSQTRSSEALGTCVGLLARKTRKDRTLQAMMREMLGWEEVVSLKVMPSPGDIRGGDAGGVGGTLGEEVKELGVRPA